jgi:hypothetical protein
MGPWSKLERRLRDLPDPGLDLRFRFTAYRQDVIETPRHCGELACKIWITLGRGTIWAVPNDRDTSGRDDAGHIYGRRSPGWLVEIAAEYLDLPRQDRLAWRREWEGWGLVDILKACDRSIGRRRWPMLRERLREPVALALLDIRAKATPWPNLALGGRDRMSLHDPD